MILVDKYYWCKVGFIMNEKEIIRSKGSCFKYIALVLGIVFLILSFIFDKFTYGVYSSGIWIFCVVILFVLGIFTFLSEMSTIIVFEKKVHGKTFFGKVVDLPIDSISAVGYVDLTKTLTITTSSGIIQFQLINNYKEIYEEISKLISNRQNKTINRSNDSLDDLKKLKELLDSGVITKKEFEEKKKKILDI